MLNSWFRVPAYPSPANHSLGSLDSDFTLNQGLIIYKLWFIVMSECNRVYTTAYQNIPEPTALFLRLCNFLKEGFLTILLPN